MQNLDETTKTSEIISEEESRKNAILNCYGAKAYQEERTIMLSDGEEITYWLVNGYLELIDIQNTFTDDQIVDIYDSGE